MQNRVGFTDTIEGMTSSASDDSFVILEESCDILNDDDEPVMIDHIEARTGEYLQEPHLQLPKISTPPSPVILVDIVGGVCRNPLNSSHSKVIPLEYDFEKVWEAMNLTPPLESLDVPSVDVVSTPPPPGRRSKYRIVLKKSGQVMACPNSVDLHPPSIEGKFSRMKHDEHSFNCCCHCR